MQYLLAAMLMTTPAMAGFDEQWGDALQDIETMQRRLYSDPRTVKTDRILPTQAKAVAPEEVKPVKKPKKKYRKRRYAR